MSKSGSFRSTLLASDKMLTGTIRSLLMRSRLSRGLAILVAHAGDSAVVIPGLMIWWLGRGVTEYHHFLPLWSSLIAASAITVMVKFSIRRRRPAGGRSHLYRKMDPFSFPSGHAVRCFNIAGCVFFLYSPAAGLVLLAWALAVTIARVANGIHFVSDIVAGALLGTALAAISSALVAIGIVPVLSA